MLEREGKGDGQVPRNMRLMAVMIDVVQPYIITHPSGLVHHKDPKTALMMRWSVRGCFGVNASTLFWGHWPTDEARKEAQSQGFPATQSLDMSKLSAVRAVIWF